MFSPHLAERLRPKSLDDFIEQEHLIGDKSELILNLSYNNIYPMKSKDKLFINSAITTMKD